MERDRTEQATPDLFSTAAPSEEPSPTPPAKQVSFAQNRRHVLPKDLPKAVKQLPDRELDLLIAASVEEAKRRGRLLPNVQANQPDEPTRKRSSRMAKSSHSRQGQVANVALARGQQRCV